jgi:hypothetical protein
MNEPAQPGHSNPQWISNLASLLLGLAFGAAGAIVQTYYVADTEAYTSAKLYTSDVWPAPRLVKDTTTQSVTSNTITESGCSIKNVSFRFPLDTVLLELEPVLLRPDGTRLKIYAVPWDPSDDNILPKNLDPTNPYVQVFSITGMSDPGDSLYMAVQVESPRTDWRLMCKVSGRGFQDGKEVRPPFGWAAVSALAPEVGALVLFLPIIISLGGLVVLLRRRPVRKPPQNLIIRP